MTSPLRTLYEQHGFVIVPGLIGDDKRQELEHACERIIARTRSGSWPHRRTVGKQFPPYGNDNVDSWGVQHLMHPDLGENAFIDWYTSEAVTDVCKELLSCREEDLQLGMYHCFH